MRRSVFLLLLFINFACPAQTVSTAKPWTYWWWMGSAVSKSDISAQLQFFKSSGLGGAHIIPIYGVKGFEEKAINFLSPQWIEMMDFTVQEAKKLGLGVDLTTGTGWPFGGPNVPASLAAKSMSVKDREPMVNLTKQKVKRAAPGGEGFVLDPFHKDAMTKYLMRFDSAFRNVEALPRSMYMDSYEAYGANWTEDFPDEFAKRRKYDITEKINALTDSTGDSAAELIRIDYHQTLAELLLERYAEPWTTWSKQKGFLTRYQAHGSPGNLLDLYATAAIPETESFGTSRFEIPGLRVDPDYSIEQFGTPNPLAMKFASSAAHFYGKKLVSSETGTWLANHFKVSLSQIKPQVDELFASGINHIFYHGTTYSPVNEPYPGWLFYASTNFGPNAHFAKQFPLLNNYVAFCQHRLQNSKPDNDILVYFPIHDLWATKAKSSGNVHLLEVHHVDRWLLDLPFGQLSQKLWNKGYTFDFVSDMQLKTLRVGQNGRVLSPAAEYKTILVPASTYMPMETLDELERLAAAGANIVFEKNMPNTVTGFFEHAERQKSFVAKTAAMRNRKSIQVAGEFEKALAKNNIYPEELSEKGLTFIRKKKGNGEVLYFVTNLGNTFQQGWVKLGKGTGFSRIDQNANNSELPQRKSGAQTEIYLKLLPGQSCFIESGAKPGTSVANVKPPRIYEIRGSWHLRFNEGKPSTPEPTTMDHLVSWTKLSDSAAYFSGTASYRIEFDLPASLKSGKKILLDLGDVRETAAVRLNGKSLGTLWSIPFQTYFDPALLKLTGNVLEVEVTNLSANYMRLRDKQEPDWKKFTDINIVDITYKKFDASKWEPMPSGLLGPVRLIAE